MVPRSKDVTSSHSNEMKAVAFSPNSKWVLSVNGDNTAEVWEAVSGQEVAKVIHQRRVLYVIFSRDGKWIASAGGEEPDHGGEVRVWEAATGREVARIDTTTSVDDVAFSPNSKQVFVPDYDMAIVHVLDVATGKEIAPLHHKGVLAVAISPDGKRIVTGGEDHIARVWDAVTGKEIAHVVHKETVSSVAFSPDGNLIASGPSSWFSGQTVEAWIWEAATGRVLIHITNTYASDLTVRVNRKADFKNHR